MTKSVCEKIENKIQEVLGHYHRLILVIGPSGSGKTAALREIHQKQKFPMINAGLELSRQMLELTEKQRMSEAERLLENAAAQTRSDVVLVDNTEILFDPALKINPLGILRKLSRTRTIAASWNGMVKKGWLVYAVPGHPEYRREKIEDEGVVMSDE